MKICEVCGSRIPLFRIIFPVNKNYISSTKWCSSSCKAASRISSSVIFEIKRIGVECNTILFYIKELTNKIDHQHFKSENIQEPSLKIPNTLQQHLSALGLSNKIDLPLENENKSADELKIKEQLRVLGISKPIITSKRCPTCNTEIKTNRKSQVCCSKSCARKRFFSLNKTVFIKRPTPKETQQEIKYPKEMKKT